MKKSEHKFNRGAKKQIDTNAQENRPQCWSRDHNPIYIPKRKKKK